MFSIQILTAYHGKKPGIIALLLVIEFYCSQYLPRYFICCSSMCQIFNQPCFLHEKAVKHISCYLYLTRNQGLILQPKPDHSLNAYADADVSSQWHQAFSHLCNNSLYWTGYVLIYCGCPICWTSKLQTEIALSTTEAKYQGLSACMHDLLLLFTLIQKLASNTFIDHMYLHGTQLFSSTLTSHIYGNNQSCLTLVTTNAVCPWTKHLSIKFHHFWDQGLNRTVQVIKVHTNDNWANIFTKPLLQVKFECLRHLLMGW